MKKILALVLALAVILSISISAAAAGSTDKLVIGTSDSYQTLQPFQGATHWGTQVYQPLGARETIGGEFKGILAESWERLDELTYRVKIWDNITDSDGNKITADDVVFSFEEAARIGELTKLFALEKVEKVDDYTVDFTWKEVPAAGGFENVMNQVFIVSQAAYENGDMGRMPVATGPYKVTNFASDVSVSLALNENYWAREDQITMARMQQTISEIEVKTISESSQLTMALQTKTIDMTKDISSQDVPMFTMAPGYTVEEAPGTNGYVLYPNCSEDNILSDINLRKALFAAININAIAERIQSGYCDPLYSMGCTQLADYNPEWEQIHAQFDLEAAQTFLDQSNYKGETLRLITVPFGYGKDIGELIQGQASKIGIKISVQAPQIGNFLAMEHDPSQWDLLISPIASNDYVTTAWGSFFDGYQTGTGMSKNFVDDQELQDLLHTALSVEGHADPANLDACWGYMMEMAYCNPLVNPNIFYVYDNSKIESVDVSGEGMVQSNAFVVK